MLSLGRLVGGPASQDESDWVSDGTTEATTPSRSQSPVVPSDPSSSACLSAATTSASLGNVPKSFPPASPTSAVKGLQLQLISTALSVGPTLLPPHLANLITALALSMRVSLRATAFFVEAILESCKYGTAVGLGLTRRALIAAVSSARSVYAVREGLDWAGDRLASLHGNDIFLSVLDKYTNLGIYLITHTFTLAELFAMSGFYLTSTAVHTGISAAQESVALFDGIFGSNESSRALSSIITLVRTEVMHDMRLAERKMGTVRSLTALTKALTAYACLQMATRKKFTNIGQQKVLFDCTVVGQLDEDASGRIDVHAQSPSASPPTSGSSQSPWNPGKEAQNPPDDSSYLLTDVRSALNHQNQQTHQGQSPRTSPPTQTQEFPGSSPEATSQNEEDAALVRQLEHMVGQDPEEYVEGGERRRRWVEKGEQDSYYEITEQVTEHVTETQTVEHYQAADLSRLRTSATAPKVPLLATVVDDEDWIEVENGFTPPREDDQANSDDEKGSPPHVSSRLRLVAIESSPNGSPAPVSTVATRAYNDALDNPQESSARVQVILKTITRRLLQKKRTIKRIRASSPGSPPPVPRNTISRARSGLTELDVGEKERFEGDLAEVDDLLLASPVTDSDAPLTPSAILGPAGELLYPPQDVHMASPSYSAPSLSPSRRTLPVVAANTPRKGRRQELTHASKSSPPSPPSLGSLSRALVRAKGKFHPRTPSTDSPTRGSSPSSSSIDTSTRSRFATRQPSRPLFSKGSLSSSTSSIPFPAKVPPKESQRKPPVSGLVGGRRGRHESVTSTQTRESHSQFHSSTQAPPSNEASPAALYPDDHLIKNIHKFCRFSSAAYGQNFLRVLGLGSTDFMFPSGGRYHPNTWAFAQHTNLPIECMLLSSHVDPGPSLSKEKLNPLVHYIAVDHAAKAIVLTCRGTLGLSDVLVDLCCEYEQIEIEGGDPDQTYLTHSGMLFSARKLMGSASTVHETVRKALEDYPTYGLVLTGHSLGGGAAALLSILWSCPTTYFDQHVASLPGAQGTVGPRTPFVTNFSSGLPPGRPIHCYTYGCPCVASADLASYTKGLISSIVQNNDIVPTLSLGILRDFKNISVTLSDEGSVTEEIVGRVVGIQQRRLRNKYGPALLQSGTASISEVPDLPRPRMRLSPEELKQGHSRNYAGDDDYRDPAKDASPDQDLPDEQQLLEDWFFSLYKTLKADMNSEKLYPPGKVYSMEHWEVFLTGTPTGSPRLDAPPKVSQKEAHRVVLRLIDNVPERFGELSFSKSMLNDHLPTNYEKSTALLYQGLFGS